MTPHYTIVHQPLLRAAGADPSPLQHSAWAAISALAIDQFRPESNSIRPRTQLQLCHNDAGLWGLFSVVEQGVVSRVTQAQGEVWKDSCVELFLQPPDCAGYFNFEWNAGGCLHASYVTDWRRGADGTLAARRLLSTDELNTIASWHSLPSHIPSPLNAIIHWQLAFCIPWSLFAPSISRALPWRGNAYKCAEHGPHPHWAAWSAIPALNFHCPEAFAVYGFAMETTP